VLVESTEMFTESHLHKHCKFSPPETPPDPPRSDNPYDDSNLQPQGGSLTTPLGPKLVRSDGHFWIKLGQIDTLALNGRYAVLAFKDERWTYLDFIKPLCPIMDLGVLGNLKR
jgi:hypothetical protein